MMFNIENCDVTMENGYLRLIYHTDKLPVPMVLAVTKSYHDLNEKAMQLFDGNDWTESVVEWNLRKEDPIWHNLLADIYVSHNDMYKKTMAVNKKEPTKYIALEFTGEKNEQGHRMGRLDFEDLKKMGVVLKRAVYFITCSGRMMYPVQIHEDAIAAQLISEEKRKQWQLSQSGLYRQMSLFDDFHMAQA